MFLFSNVVFFEQSVVGVSLKATKIFESTGRTHKRNRKQVTHIHAKSPEANDTKVKEANEGGTTTTTATTATTTATR